MAEHENSPPKGKKELGGELIIPLLGLSFTLYYFTTIWDLKWEAKLNGFLTGGILVLLVVIFVARSAYRLIQGGANLGLGPLRHKPAVQKTRALLLLLSIGLIFFIQWLGFTLSIALFLFAALWLLGIRSRRLLVGLPILLSVSGYILFIWLLDSRLPHGPVELLMERFF